MLGFRVTFLASETDGASSLTPVSDTCFSFHPFFYLVTFLVFGSLQNVSFHGFMY